MIRNVSLSILLILFSTSIFAQSKQQEINHDIIFKADTITWFGSDFSLFRLSNKKKVGQEEKLLKYFYAWNEYYKLSISNVKIASWLNVKKVFNDKEFTDKSYKKFLPSIWIQENPHTISLKEIKNHLLNYTSTYKGIGLTFIIESFHKGDPSRVHGHFIWFDIESKAIIHTFKTSGGPSSGYTISGGIIIGGAKDLPKQNGMTGYWLNGMVDCTLNFKINFRENKPND